MVAMFEGFALKSLVGLVPYVVAATIGAYAGGQSVAYFKNNTISEMKSEKATILENHAKVLGEINTKTQRALELVNKAKDEVIAYQSEEDRKLQSILLDGQSRLQKAIIEAQRNQSTIAEVPACVFDPRRVSNINSAGGF